MIRGAVNEDGRQARDAAGRDRRDRTDQAARAGNGFAVDRHYRIPGADAGAEGRTVALHAVDRHAVRRVLHRHAEPAAVDAAAASGTGGGLSCRYCLIRTSSGEDGLAFAASSLLRYG